MKKIICTLLVLTGLFSACSKDDVDVKILPDELGEIDSNNYYYGYDAYGVNVWYKSDTVKLSKYGTYVDEKLYPDYIIEKIILVCNDTNNINIKWSTNGKIIDQSKRISGGLDPKGPKYMVSNNIKIEAKNMKNLTIEALVEYQNTTVKRYKTIPVIELYDFDGFNLGTPRAKLPYVRDLSPTLSVLSEIENEPNVYWKTIGEFKDDKLNKIHVVCTPPHEYEVYSPRGFMRSHGAPKELQVTFKEDKYTVENPMEWKYGKLTMKAYNIDLTAFDMGINACLSAE